MAAGVYDAALGYLQTALQTWEREANSAHQVVLYHKIGKLHLKAGRVDDALRAYIECETHWSALRRQVRIDEVYYGLAEVYLKKGEQAQAKIYIERAIRELRTKGSPRLPVALYFAARIERDQGRIEEAERLYVEASNVLEGIGDTLGLASVYFDLGSLEEQRSSADMAAKYYKKSLDNYSALGSYREQELKEKIASLVTKS
jgi:tetratricopeptide (TPR) repeat protein